MGNGKREMEELKTDYGETKHFTHIEAWKIDRQIRRKIYGIIKILPDEEKYCLFS